MKNIIGTAIISAKIINTRLIVEPKFIGNKFNILLVISKNKFVPSFVNVTKNLKRFIYSSTILLRFVISSC